MPNVNNVPAPVWAVLLVVIGASIAIIAYVHPGSSQGEQAMYQLATTIAGGALGVFVSHAKSNVDVASGNGPVTIATDAKS